MTKTKSVIKKIPSDALKRMKNRPYYAFLYAKNILKGRLPEKVEEVFVNDPHSAYLYAKNIVKGKLSDCVHTAFVIGDHKDEESKKFIALYLKEFCKN